MIEYKKGPMRAEYRSAVVIGTILFSNTFTHSLNGYVPVQVQLTALLGDTVSDIYVDSPLQEVLIQHVHVQSNFNGLIVKETMLRLYPIFRPSLHLLIQWATYLHRKRSMQTNKLCPPMTMELNVIPRRICNIICRLC